MSHPAAILADGGTSWLFVEARAHGGCHGQTVVRVEGGVGLVAGNGCIDTAYRRAFVASLGTNRGNATEIADYARARGRIEK